MAMGENGGGIGDILKPFMAPPLTAATGGSKEDVMRSLMMTLGALGAGGLDGSAGRQLFPQLMDLQQPQNQQNIRWNTPRR